jgi:hypothetical protein
VNGGISTGEIAKCELVRRHFAFFEFHLSIIEEAFFSYGQAREISAIFIEP